ncbi:hypothetical protein NDN08_001233 [Rhodosorus marinus]|uniref:Mandelate racemase/muconate lactonizing enzyme C-terminal domain-containing protein n=1 Tax=Rhodosorus marinus TaxID=101924 RepID=A0AAV8UQ64_9RHOD|nr:hypothetical protein NDN08_001233 [Rhodosorus marinus]
MSLAFTEAGDRRIVSGVWLLLHGFLGDKEPIFEAFVSRIGDGERVVAIDLPLHGESASVSVEDVAEAAALVRETADDLEIRSCIVVGYSLGGRVALSLAASVEHGLVENLILISSDPGLPSTGSERSDRMERDLEYSRKIQANFDQFLHGWYSAGLWGSSLSEESKQLWIRRIKRVNTQRNMSKAVVAYSPARMTSLWEFLLGPASPPSLMICGSEDRKYVAITRRASQRHFSAVVPDAGHNCLHQAIDAVVRTTVTFKRILRTMSTPCVQTIEQRRFSLALRKKMSVAGRSTVDHREGLVVILKAKDSKHGVGEASPLPGFHKGTLLEDVAEVSKACEDVLGESQTFQLLLRLRSTPTVQCAMEMASLQLIAAQVDSELDLVMATILRLRWSVVPKAHVFINSVVPRVVDPSAYALSLVGQGYSVMKMKVGGGSLEDDASNVNLLCKALEDHGSRLRLDANRSWTLDEATSFWKSLERPHLIEFIEEPLEDPEELPQFYARTGLRFALDENLVESETWWKHSVEDGLAAYVVKPTVIGGLVPTVDLIRKGASAARVIVSSTFDSGLMLSYLSIFASLIEGEADTAHGLGTFEILAEDTIDPPFSSFVSDGKISLEKCRATLRSHSAGPD